jgi:hypothetical protein
MQWQLDTAALLQGKVSRRLRQLQDRSRTRAAILINSAKKRTEEVLLRHKENYDKTPGSQI